MTKGSPTFQDLYKALDDFRKENNMRFDNLEKKIDSNYITREEANLRFKSIDDKISPLQKVIYGVITTIGLAVIGALLKLIFIK